MDETSQPIELLLSVTRDGSRTLGAQIEDQLRRAIREGTLRVGTRVPSTRDLARQLGVSRRVVVGAYEQLAAEGYLALRQGARPRVSEAALRGEVTAPESAGPARLSLGLPPQPRTCPLPTGCLSALAARGAGVDTSAELGYGDPRGVEALRSAWRTTSAACAAWPRPARVVSPRYSQAMARLPGPAAQGRSAARLR